MRVHLWGTFAKPLSPRGSSGIMWAVNQNKCRHLLSGDTETPWYWGVHWMETHFLQYVSLLKREPRHRCSLTVQPYTDMFILYVYKFWVTYPKLYFSKVRKHVVKLKSLYSSTSYFTIKVKFDKIQFEGYCKHRPNYISVTKILFVYFKTVPGVSILPLDNYLCYE